MRTSTSDRLTAATAEQLLDGGAGPACLHHLLAAAAGPGTASELAGETAAVAAFADAPRASPLPSAPIRRPSMLSTLLSKIVAAKALAAVVLLAGTTGGVALAASASGTSSPTEGTSATASSTATSSPSDDPERGGEKTGAGKSDPTTSPAPHPSLAGLCNAWAAGATDNPGAAADNPAFGSLIEAAGSPDEVPGYCADLADADQHGQSATAPGRDGERPQAPPADNPGAADRGVPPTAAPGNPDHPTGPPAERAEQDGDTQDGETQEKDSRKKSEDDVRNGNSSGSDRRPNS